MMNFLGRDDDTICAVATPPGKGGIAIVRVSGSRAIEVAKKCCQFLPEVPESHRVYYGWLRLESIEIDEVLVTFFAAGRSFTGEATIEISCHGSPTITQQILEALLESGARMAHPGEFTYRAFSSGRIDLIQAEAVLGLIESQSKRASRLALQQLQGETSEKIRNIEDILIWTLAHCEANIDFASEDIHVADVGQILNRLHDAKVLILKLISSYKHGRSLAEGVHVSLIGSPNVGKSSLLNAILGYEKAIVTNIPGTTRDVVEGDVWFEGVRLRIYDTAGIRQSSNAAEVIGIQRSLEIPKATDMNLLVIDISEEGTFDENWSQIEGLKPENCAVVFNKMDVGHFSYQIQRELLDRLCRQTGWHFLGECPAFLTSAKLGQGIHELLQYIVSPFTLRDVDETSSVITSVRQLEALTRSLAAVEQSCALIEQNESPDFVAFELQNALLPIQEVLGKQFDDDVLDRVFQEFCLGK